MARPGRPWRMKAIGLMSPLLENRGKHQIVPRNANGVPEPGQTPKTTKSSVFRCKMPTVRDGNGSAATLPGRFDLHVQFLGMLFEVAAQRGTEPSFHLHRLPAIQFAAEFLTPPVQLQESPGE